MPFFQNLAYITLFPCKKLKLNESLNHWIIEMARFSFTSHKYWGKNVQKYIFHSDFPCRTFFNRKLILTRRRWRSKQKNKTKNYYFRFERQSFFRSYFQILICNELLVLSFFFSFSPWRRFVFQTKILGKFF